MKKLLCLLTVSVLTIGLTGCNQCWPRLFCRNGGWHGAESYEAYDAIDEGSCCPTASSGSEWRPAPTVAPVESLPGPATSTRTSS